MPGYLKYRIKHTSESDTSVYRYDQLPPGAIEKMKASGAYLSTDDNLKPHTCTFIHRVHTGPGGWRYWCAIQVMKNLKLYTLGSSNAPDPPGWREDDVEMSGVVSGAIAVHLDEFKDQYFKCQFCDETTGATLKSNEEAQYQICNCYSPRGGLMVTQFDGAVKSIDTPGYIGKVDMPKVYDTWKAAVDRGASDPDLKAPIPKFLISSAAELMPKRPTKLGYIYIMLNARARVVPCCWWGRAEPLVFTTDHFRLIDLAVAREYALVMTAQRSSSELVCSSNLGYSDVADYEFQEGDFFYPPDPDYYFKNILLGRWYDWTIPHTMNNQRFIYVLDSERVKFTDELASDHQTECAEFEAPWHFESGDFIHPTNCSHPECEVKYRWGHVCNGGGAFDLQTGTACPAYTNPLIDDDDDYCSLKHMYAGDSITAGAILRLMWLTKQGQAWTKEEWENLWEVPYIWATTPFNPQKEYSNTIKDLFGKTVELDGSYANYDLYACKTRIDLTTGKVETDAPKLLPGGTVAAFQRPDENTLETSERTPDFPSTIQNIELAAMSSIVVLWPADLSYMEDYYNSYEDYLQAARDAREQTYTKVAWNRTGMTTCIVGSALPSNFSQGLYCLNLSYLSGKWANRGNKLKDYLQDSDQFKSKIQRYYFELWTDVTEGQASGKKPVLDMPLLHTTASDLGGLFLFEAVPLHNLVDENWIMLFAFNTRGFIDATYVKVDVMFRRGYVYQEETELMTSWKTIWNGRPSLFMDESKLNDAIAAGQEDTEDSDDTAEDDPDTDTDNDDDEEQLDGDADTDEDGKISESTGEDEESDVSKLYVPYLASDRNDQRDIDNYKKIDMSNQPEGVHLSIPENSGITKWNYLVAGGEEDIVPSYSFPQVAKKVKVYSTREEDGGPGPVLLARAGGTLGVGEDSEKPNSEIGTWYKTKDCSGMIILLLNPEIFNNHTEFMIFNIYADISYETTAADGTSYMETQSTHLAPMMYHQVTNRVFPAYYKNKEATKKDTKTKYGVDFGVVEMSEDIELVERTDIDRHPWVVFARAIGDSYSPDIWPGNYEDSWFPSIHKPDGSQDIPDTLVLPDEAKVKIRIEFAYVGDIVDHNDNSITHWQDNDDEIIAKTVVNYRHPKSGLIRSVFAVDSGSDDNENLIDGKPNVPVGSTSMATLWPYARWAARDLEITYVWRNEMKGVELAERGNSHWTGKGGHIECMGIPREFYNYPQGDHDLGTEYQPKLTFYTKQVTQTGPKMGDGTGAFYATEEAAEAAGFGPDRVVRRNTDWVEKTHDSLEEKDPLDGFPSEYLKGYTAQDKPGALYYPYTRAEKHSVFVPRHRTYLWEFLDHWRNKFHDPDNLGVGRMQGPDYCIMGTMVTRYSDWWRHWEYDDSKETEFRGRWRTRGPVYQLEYYEFHDVPKRTIYLKPYVERSDKLKPFRKRYDGSTDQQWLTLVDAYAVPGAAEEADPEDSTVERNPFTGCNTRYSRTRLGSYVFGSDYVDGSPTSPGRIEEQETAREKVEEEAQKSSRYYSYEQKPFGFNTPWSPFDSPPLFGNTGREMFIVELCTIGSIISWEPKDTTESVASSFPNIPSWWSGYDPDGQPLEKTVLLAPPIECTRALDPLGYEAVNPFYHYIMTDSNLFDEEAPTTGEEEVFETTYTPHDLRIVTAFNTERENVGKPGFRSDIGRFTMTMESGSNITGHKIYGNSQAILEVADSPPTYEETETPTETEIQEQMDRGSATLRGDEIYGLELWDGQTVDVGYRYPGFYSPIDHSRYFFGYKDLEGGVTGVVHWAWPTGNRDKMNRKETLIRWLSDTIKNEEENGTKEDVQKIQGAGINGIVDIKCAPYVPKAEGNDGREISAGPELKKVSSGDPQEDEPKFEDTYYVLVVESERMKGGRYRPPILWAQQIDNPGVDPAEYKRPTEDTVPHIFEYGVLIPGKLGDDDGDRATEAMTSGQFYRNVKSNEDEGLTGYANLLTNKEANESGAKPGFIVGSLSARFLGKFYQIDKVSDRRMNGTNLIVDKGRYGYNQHIVTAELDLKNQQFDLMYIQLDFDDFFKESSLKRFFDNTTDTLTMELLTTAMVATVDPDASEPVVAQTATWRTDFPLESSKSAFYEPDAVVVTYPMNFGLSVDYKFRFTFYVTCSPSNFDQGPWYVGSKPGQLSDLFKEINLQYNREGKSAEVIKLEEAKFVVSTGKKCVTEGNINKKYNFFTEADTDWYKAQWESSDKKIEREKGWWTGDSPDSGAPDYDVFDRFADRMQDGSPSDSYSLQDEDFGKWPAAQAFPDACVEIPELPQSRLKIEYWEEERKEGNKDWTYGGVWTTRIAGPEWVSSEEKPTRDFIWWPAPPYYPGKIILKGRLWVFEDQYKDEAKVMDKKKTVADDPYNEHSINQTQGFGALLRTIEEFELVRGEARQSANFRRESRRASAKNKTKYPASARSFSSGHNVNPWSYLSGDPYYQDPAMWMPPVAGSLAAATQGYHTAATRGWQGVMANSQVAAIDLSTKSSRNYQYWDRKEYVFFDDLGIDPDVQSWDSLKEKEQYQEELFEVAKDLSEDNYSIKATAIIPYSDWDELMDLSGYYDKQDNPGRSYDREPYTPEDLSDRTAEVEFTWKDWTWKEVASFSFRNEEKDKHPSSGDTTWEKIIIRDCGTKRKHTGDLYSETLIEVECGPPDEDCDELETKWEEDDLPLPDNVKGSGGFSRADPWWRF